MHHMTRERRLKTITRYTKRKNEEAERKSKKKKKREGKEKSVTCTHKISSPLYPHHDMIKIIG
jgi:hypothetical protein